MNQFNQTVRQVKYVARKFIISNLTTALKPKPFVDFLYAEEPQTLGKLQNKTTKFIRIEEMRAFEKQWEEAFVGENMDDKRSFRENDKGGGPHSKDFP